MSRLKTAALSAARCERNLSLCVDGPFNLVWVMHVPLLPVVFLLGLVGNCLVILVTCKRRLQSTGCLIVALAVADTLYVITFSLQDGISRLTEFNRRAWLFDLSDFIAEHLGKYLIPLIRFHKCCSTWIIVLITCERFIVVTKPLEAASILSVKRTLASITATVLVLFVFWTPVVFLMVTVHDCKVCRGAWTFQGMRLANDFGKYFYIALLSIIYNTAGGGMLALMVSVIAPMSLLLVMNSMIVVCLYRARWDRKNMSNLNRASTDESRMLFVVLLAFILLESPNLLVSGVKENRYLTDLSKASEFLSVFNSAINFLIYVAFGRRFKNDIISLFGNCRRS